MAENGAFISLSEASGMTAAYRAKIKEGETISQLYDKDLIQQILDQRGCEGIRTYFGEDNGSRVVVMVGTDAKGNDMTEGLILERGLKCPPYCKESNPLNS